MWVCVCVCIYIGQALRTQGKQETLQPYSNIAMSRLKRFIFKESFVNRVGADINTNFLYDISYHLF